jgi:pimeloyl-ACP methyl ester carboxylesterase
MLAHDRRGAGEPLLLIHPLGGDRHVWSPVLDLLAAERDVIAVDLPGFGESEQLNGDRGYSPAELAAAVGAFAAELGLERPHVAGNSLGGWVALELAAAGRAASVTAIAPAGLWREPLVPKRSPVRGVARALLPVLRPLLRPERGRRLVLAANAAHPERIPPDAALALVRAYATAPGFEAINDAMRASRFTALGEISVPVTLAWPEHDRLVRRPRSLPVGVRSVVLRGCGHLPTWDDPEQVARVLLEGSAGEPRH